MKEQTQTGRDMMKFRWKQFFAIMLVLPLLGFLSCGGGGGGGGSSSGPTPPDVTTDPATGVTTTLVTLNGTVNPNGETVEAWFEYGTSSTLASFTSTAHQTGLTGSAALALLEALSGLTPGTTYYFRVVAKITAGGTDQRGAIASFTTLPPLSPPSVTTDPATVTSTTGATLNGTVNPNDQTSEAWFEWGTSPTLATFTETTHQTNLTGSAGLPVSEALSGLNPTTTYYFRAVASNATGRTEGTILNFTTLSPPPPTVTTSAATGVTTTTADLNGTVNPNGQIVEAWFEWGTDPTLTINTPTTHQTGLTGSAALPVSEALSGLTPGTIYYFRAVAQLTPGGTPQSGVILNFTTPALPPPPTVVTGAASGIGIDNAVLNGTVNPNGQVSEAWFEFGTDNTLTTFTATIHQTGLTGTAALLVTEPISGLTPATIYYFRVAASNATGTTKGTIQMFTTLALPPPTVTTTAATGITTTDATLNGTVNPNGQTVEAWFEWGTDPTLTVFTASVHQMGLTGSTALPVSEALTGLLAPGTTYYFRAAAQITPGGTVQRGNILQFTTPSPPTVTTGAAQGITPTSAILNGTVNPNGQTTEAWFDWGTDPTLTVFSETLPHQTGFTGISILPVSEGISGLTNGTTYYFRAVASNATGTTEGAIESFVATTVAHDFEDDFADNTVSSYAWVQTGTPPAPPPVLPQFNYDPVGEQLEILTANDTGLIFSANLPAGDNGVFSVDFLPRVTYPSGGGIWIRLMQDANNYYELEAYDPDSGIGPGQGQLTKWVGGVAVDNVALTNVNNYISGEPPSTYPVTINFSPTMTTVTAFGEIVSIDNNTTSINVDEFEIELGQQDAYIDNIVLDLFP